MRFFTLKLLLLLFVPFLCFSALETGRVDHHISFEAQLVYLKRSKIDERCIARVTKEIEPFPVGPVPPIPIPPEPPEPFEPILPGPCGDPWACKLDTQDFIHDMTFEPGLRAAVSFMPNQDFSLEARYLGFFHWKGEEKTICSHGLEFPFKSPKTTHDFVLASVAEGFYDTNLRSADLNFWRHVTPRRINYFSVSWTAGLRYFYIKEEFKITYRRESNISDYRVRTDNNVCGFQMGVDLQVNPYDQVTWGILARWGLAGNFGRQRSKLNDLNNTVVLRDFNPKGWNFAYYGEAAPFIKVYFFPNFFMNVSYEVLFIGNLVLAPNQLGYNDSGSGLNHTGRVIYHGAYGGLGFEF